MVQTGVSRPELVIDIFLNVGLSCKGLKSAKVLETASRSKKHETIVEGQRLRTVHTMERTCTCIRARIYMFDIYVRMYLFTVIFKTVTHNMLNTTRMIGGFVPVLVHLCLSSSLSSLLLFSLLLCCGVFCAVLLCVAVCL